MVEQTVPGRQCESDNESDMSAGATERERGGIELIFEVPENNNNKKRN